MSGKVSNMYKSSFNRTAILVVCLGLPLAGCASDNFFADEAATPYGGSKLHPIKVSGGKAHVADCGLWPENVADSASNEMSYNHGCAVQSNIAAMAAYPSDLVHLRKMSRKPAFNRVGGVKSLASGSAGAAAAAPAASSSSAAPAATP